VTLPSSSVRRVGRVRLSMPSSYAKSAAILTPARAAPLPALSRSAPHEMSAVRAALKREPAEDQTDAGREPYAHH
jgi:hypothetical protein